jgi:hypothetical protein
MGTSTSRADKQVPDKPNSSVTKTIAPNVSSLTSQERSDIAAKRLAYLAKSARPPTKLKPTPENQAEKADYMIRDWIN